VTTSRNHRRPAGPLPELLAPAGSPEAFRAAVAAGADAVYLSGKRFGARKFAANFSDAEIEEAVRFAHIRGVRIYVTVNTLIHDRELSGVMDYLLWLYGIGVDAVLIQDTGVAALAREIVPGLVLHASTQMTIHNTDGVRWAAKHGFRRVVLARELTLAEVRRISEETRDLKIGLEIFSHGALCYSYSGQCLLSSVIGGRSGNRGMCAQPCRKPYSLVAGDADEYGRPQSIREISLPGHYLLSPKDLCTYPGLGDIAGSVASVKIEGRMKSPQYVAAVVATYRRALDAIERGLPADAGNAMQDLGLSFSRGFTRGYLLGDRHDALMGRDAPDNRGLDIGVVTRYDRKTGTAFIRLTGSYIPAPGDGIRFSGAGSGREWGFSLNTVPVPEKDGIRMVVPQEVLPKTRVAVTFSRELENRANRIISDPSKDLLRALPLDLDLAVGPDGSLDARGKILLPGRQPVLFSVHPDLLMEPARSQPLSKETLVQQMQKTGGSPFAIHQISFDYAGDRFAPVSKINQVRREILAAAEEALIRASLPAPEALAEARGRREAARTRYNGSGDAKAGTGNHPGLCLAVYTDTPDGVAAAAGSGADTICFEPDIPMTGHLCQTGSCQVPVADLVEKALAVCRDSEIRFAWKFPRITRDAYLEVVLPLIPRLIRAGLGECMVEHPANAVSLSGSVPPLVLSGGPGLNIFNHIAAGSAGALFSLITLSPELSLDEIQILTARAAQSGNTRAFSLVVQGAAEAMITDDCILRLVPEACPKKTITAGRPQPGFFGLRDETGRIFPARADGSCRTVIANSAELCLLDHLPAIRAAGIREVSIDARGKPPRYTQEMTALYRAAVDHTNAERATSRDPALAALKEKAQQISAGGITSGHFLRGLKE
jgi:putative protease